MGQYQGQFNNITLVKVICGAKTIQTQTIYYSYSESVEQEKSESLRVMALILMVIVQECMKREITLHCER